MKLDIYTDRVKGFLQSAQTLAQNAGHQRITLCHILKVIIDDPEGLGASLIQGAGGNVALVQKSNADTLSRWPRSLGQRSSIWTRRWKKLSATPNKHQKLATAL